METVTKWLLSAGLLGGGVGIPLITYDQMVWKPTRQENSNYKKIFEKNKELLKSTISELSDIENPEEALPKIREFCVQIKESLRKNEKIPIPLLYICKGRISTVRELFPNNLIEKDEDYGPSLFALKKAFRQETLKEEQELKDIFGEINTNEQLKNWCKTELDKPFLERGFQVVMWVGTFCHIRSIDTVEKEITKSFTKTTLERASDWKGTFEKWKETPDFLTFLNKDQTSPLNDKSNSEEGGKRLQEWCEKSLSTRLSVDTDPKFIKHVEYACSGKNPTSMPKTE